MTQQVAPAPLPLLPSRARPPQVLLGVGAVLLVSAGAAGGSAYGGTPARAVLLLLAAVATGFALRAAAHGLRSSPEVLAASATGLAVSAGGIGADAPGGAAATAALAAVFLALHRAAPSTATWPLASWLAAQVAVLRALEGVPADWRTPLYLAVALAGLGIALCGRRAVARIALLTTVPWWLVGVVGGSTTAWTGPVAERFLAAVLVVGAGMGLVLTRLRGELEPLAGPPRAAPVLAGLLSGTAVTGALSVLGTAAVTLTGYAGVLLASSAAAVLTGWRRGLLLPLALAGGTVMTLLAVARLLADRQWTALSVLLLLTAVPPVWVALRRPADRPQALPTAIWSLAGAVLLALPDGLLAPAAAGMTLTAVFAAALAAGAGLDLPSRRATSVAAAGCAAVAVLLLTVAGEPGALAAVLAVQGACTLAWARSSGARYPVAPSTQDAGEPSRAAWRVGAAQLVVSVWVAAGQAGAGAVEWFSLPAAAGLLLAAGPGLLRGSSWAHWGPALLVAAVPSTALAVCTADAPRTVAVLVLAAVVMVAGARAGLRAPLDVGAGAALAVAFGLAVRALPGPLVAAAVVGGLLLAVGMRRERHPVRGFATRLTDLR